ncbi:MAG TPA: DUF5989 family protein [Thermoanaerobaculia bacterium]
MTARGKSFREVAAEARSNGTMIEIFRFLKHNRKWWLVPLLVTSILLAITAYLSSSAAAPFIYSLF